jgi:cell division protein FtsW (lipid II flippase)
MERSTSPTENDDTPGLLSWAITRTLLFLPVLTIVAACAIVPDPVERSSFVMLVTKVAVVALVSYLLFDACVRHARRWRDWRTAWGGATGMPVPASAPPAPRG